MKKMIAIAFLSLASIGFSTTSALAANSVESKESTVVPSRAMKEQAIALNHILISKKSISMAEWYENVQKIVYAETEQDFKSVYDTITYKLATTSFYK